MIYRLAHISFVLILVACGNPKGGESVIEDEYTIASSRICAPEIATATTQILAPNEQKTISVTASYGTDDLNLSFSSCSSSDSAVSVTCTNSFTGTTSSIDIQASSTFNKDSYIFYNLVDGLGRISQTQSFRVTPSFPSSCKDLFDQGITTDGLYVIDSDGSGVQNPYSVYCDMTTDGGGWTKIFYHNFTNAGLFSSDGDVSLVNINKPEATTKYSILSRIADFSRGGVFELKLNYPILGQRNHWTQTSNPYTSINSVTGYAAVSIDTSVNS